MSQMSTQRCIAAAAPTTPPEIVPTVTTVDERPPASPGRLVALLSCLSVWLERYRQRRHLSSLSPHMLKDIGLSRADVEFEYRKHPWQD
jgi:uncharacterized protein YjiS (DUF1127 family)